jgi:hypothetical protein
MQRGKEWLAPLTGIVFLILVVASVIVAGDPPDATEDSAEEVLNFYVDNEDEVVAGSLLFGLAAVFLLFFAGTVRRALRDAEGSSGTLSAVAFGGAVVLAVGIATSATLAIATADIVGDVEDPVVFQTMNAIGWGYFVPMAVGTITFMVASGISIVRHAALPKWLGWVAIVAGIITFSPAFPVGIGLSALWVLTVSVLLSRGLREAGTAPPAA